MSRRTRGLLPVWWVVVVGLLTLGGCAGQGSGERANAEAAAVAFSRSIDTAPGAACDLLAPQTLKELEEAEGPCSAALQDGLIRAAGPAHSTEVYGKDAIVRLAADTIFLARFTDGWRVTAAGCARGQDGRPYECKVKGT